MKKRKLAIGFIFSLLGLMLISCIRARASNNGTSVEFEGMGLDGTYDDEIVELTYQFSMGGDDSTATYTIFASTINATGVDGNVTIYTSSQETTNRSSMDIDEIYNWTSGNAEEFTPTMNRDNPIRTYCIYIVEINETGIENEMEIFISGGGMPDPGMFGAIMQALPIIIIGVNVLIAMYVIYRKKQKKKLNALRAQLPC